MNEARTNEIYQQQNCKTTNLLANSDFSMMQVRTIKRVTVYQQDSTLFINTTNFPNDTHSYEPSIIFNYRMLQTQCISPAHRYRTKS